jgi:hypothetical protein
MQSIVLLLWQSAAKQTLHSRQPPWRREIFCSTQTTPEEDEIRTPKRRRGKSNDDTDDPISRSPKSTCEFARNARQKYDFSWEERREKELLPIGTQVLLKLVWQRSLESRSQNGSMRDNTLCSKRYILGHGSGQRESWSSLQVSLRLRNVQICTNKDLFSNACPPHVHAL